MKYEDRFKYLVGGYYGIKTMDEYESKLYILKDIEEYIINYCQNDTSIDYKYLIKTRLLSLIIGLFICFIT